MRKISGKIGGDKYLTDLLNLKSNDSFVISELDKCQDVVDALNLLIGIAASRNHQNKWDYIEDLSEIDCSHWSKILSGKSFLTEQKFILLGRKLCRNNEEKSVLRGLYTRYYVEKRLRKSTENRTKNHLSKKKYLNFLEKLKVDFAGLEPFEFLCCAIQKSILKSRQRGYFEDAMSSAKLLLFALNNNWIKISEGEKEIAYTELLMNYSYIGYCCNNFSYFQEALKAFETIRRKERFSMLSALELHLSRRFAEAFLGADLNVVYDRQKRAASLVSTENINFLRFVLLNKTRLEIDLGRDIREDELQECMLPWALPGNELEQRAIGTSIYVRWLIREAQFDQANDLLGLMMAELDRDMLNQIWARVTIREYQGLCAAREFELSGRPDLSDRAIGYFNDAITLYSSIQNSYGENRVRHLRQSVLSATYQLN